MNGYITQAPICITYTDSYDTSSLDAFVRGRLAGALKDTDTLEIISTVSGSNAMNFTIQIEHETGGADIGRVLWDGTKAGNERDDTLCDDFEDVYAGTTCANCKDVVTFALYESGVGSIRVYYAMAAALFLALFV